MRKKDSSQIQSKKNKGQEYEVWDVAKLDNLLSDGELAEGKRSNQTHKPSSGLACCWAS